MPRKWQWILTSIQNERSLLFLHYCRQWFGKTGTNETCLQSLLKFVFRAILDFLFRCSTELIGNSTNTPPYSKLNRPNSLCLRTWTVKIRHPRLRRKRASKDNSFACVFGSVHRVVGKMGKLQMVHAENGEMRLCPHNRFFRKNPKLPHKLCRLPRGHDSFNKTQSR